MSNETTSLYERIVKRLKKGQWVILKKSDGSYSVCTGMNGSKIKRTEFEADSVSEATYRAQTGQHMRLSTQDYLDGKGFKDITIYETISSPLSPAPEALKHKDAIEDAFEDCCDSDEMEEDVDIFNDDDDDYDGVGDDYDDDNYPSFTPPPSRKKSILRRVVVS